MAKQTDANNEYHGKHHLLYNFISHCPPLLLASQSSIRSWFVFFRNLRSLRYLGDFNPKKEKISDIPKPPGTEPTAVILILDWNLEFLVALFIGDAEIPNHGSFLGGLLPERCELLLSWNES